MYNRRFATAAEYYAALVAASESGMFPCVNPGVSGCCYNGPGDKHCVAGLAMPDNLLQNIGTGPKNTYPLDELVERYGGDWIPEGMTRSDLDDLQAYHDQSWSRYRGWKHDEFVNFLNGMKCFAGMS